MGCPPLHPLTPSRGTPLTAAALRPPCARSRPPTTTSPADTPASALCVLVRRLYMALFGGQVDALAWLNVASVLTHCVAFWLSRTDRHVRAASLVLIAEITVHAIAATVVIELGGRGFIT